MLKLLALAIVVTLCLSQDPGDDDYIACDDCKIPVGEFPKEGEMVCFAIKTVTKMVKKRVWKCEPAVKCGDFDFFCVPQEEKCGADWGLVEVPTCQLERKINYKQIERIHSDNIYQIYSPRYHGYNDYPNNTYCVWNVANTGFVSYHIVKQQLQEPSNCSGTGCDCPDSVKITMGANEVKLCGSEMPMVHTQVSSNGLHVKFCSDNKNTSKGFNLLATRFNGTVKPPTQDLNKRQATITQDQLEDNETYDNSSREFDRVTCQYKYMMHVSQPDVPCPDDDTLKIMLENHNRLMSVSHIYNGMCNDPSTMMPMMNKIEQCAVEYLYRSGDCNFAKMLVKSATNAELSGIAHGFVENALKKPKWINNGRRKCRKDDD